MLPGACATRAYPLLPRRSTPQATARQQKVFCEKTLLLSCHVCMLCMHYVVIVLCMLCMHLRDTRHGAVQWHFSNILTLNPFIMSNSQPSSTKRNVRVDLFSVALDDDKALTAMQTKLNQWLTAGTLLKYQIHTTSTHALFNVCRSKEA